MRAIFPLSFSSLALIGCVCVWVRFSLSLSVFHFSLPLALFYSNFSPFPHFILYFVLFCFVYDPNYYIRFFFRALQVYSSNSNSNNDEDSVNDENSINSLHVIVMHTYHTYVYNVYNVTTRIQPVKCYGWVISRVLCYSSHSTMCIYKYIFIYDRIQSAQHIGYDFCCSTHQRKK